MFAQWFGGSWIIFHLDPYVWFWLPISMMKLITIEVTQISLSTLVVLYDYTFLDIKASYYELKSEIDSAVARVLESGWYILGNEVEEFEDQFSKYCDAKYTVGVANGLDALHLALLAMDVRPGDEVIVPSNTFIATWLAVTHCGAIPVPVEPDLDTYNLDPGKIEAAITPKTRVIIPVHLYGRPANLDPIIEVARKHGLFVLEDAAQAHGARYKGERIGGMEMQ